MDNLPLLMFPEARTVSPPKGPPRFPPGPHVPDIHRQAERLEPKFEQIQKQFAADRAILADTLSGAEPEFVLVIETAGQIDKFQQAIDNTEGLEWLAEWDEEIEPDEDFYETNAKEEKKTKALRGRLFLSMSSQRGLEELLSLWNEWKEGHKLPHGKGKWTEVFEQVKDIRRWGVREQLIETGVLEDWEQLLQENGDESVRFQLELFYRKFSEKSNQNEADIINLINQLEGKLISPFINVENIGFHAVKVELPASSVRRIVDVVKSGQTDIALLLFPNIMFYRPTGQALVSMSVETDAIPEAPDTPVSGAPVVAILDGVPFSEHAWLKDRLNVDDADNLEDTYQPGERKHGTAMASLVVHGEMDANEPPLARPVYFIPIMQLDPNSRGWGQRLEVIEHVPDEVFYEDRIARAVRRMFEGEGETPAQAPTIKVINLSFGDPSRLFEHSLSPCARLLDWLSWKYKVLFCVSAGNYTANVDLGLSDADFRSKTDEEKLHISLGKISNQSAERRLISPAESINSITVGAIHNDKSDIKALGNRVDILPDSNFPSPINRLGYGFRRSVKPEILFSGGRQFYTPPILNHDTFFKLSKIILPPGQKVASEGSDAGAKSRSIYTRGTSNATALATRAAARIYEVIEMIRQGQPGKITDDQVSILLKALLVHGANRRDSIEKLEEYLKPLAPVKKSKEFVSKFAGYGTVDIDRVLSCTEQRATVIGCGAINQNQVHEYRFPLPPSLANENKWRRLTITLSWFTPINSSHRYFRQAALSFEPPKNEEYLHLQRSESDHNQVTRGTVQHEILESDKVSDYQDGDVLIIPVKCKADAIENLNNPIDYAIAVTLEVKEDVDIQIYQEIRTRIQTPIKVN